MAEVVVWMRERTRFSSVALSTTSESARENVGEGERARAISPPPTTGGASDLTCSTRSHLPCLTECQGNSTHASGQFKKGKEKGGGGLSDELAAHPFDLLPNTCPLLLPADPIVYLGGPGKVWWSGRRRSGRRGELERFFLVYAHLGQRLHG
jgi:hypothetical protein